MAAGKKKGSGQKTATSRTRKKSLAKKGPVRIIGIGASAGGLEAFEQFFSNMPPDSGMAFIIVQHLDPTRHSSMPEILARLTRMPVHVATDGMKIEPDSVYLIPPDRNMGVRDSSLYLEEIAEPRGLRLPVDFFLRSLAREKGPDAICVIFSGTGTDGTLGLRAVKAEAGTVFVQDPETAKYDGMPRSAIDTGLVDFVLPPQEMPGKLIDFVNHYVANGTKISAATEVAQEPMQQIFAILRTRTGHDFSRYKQSTIGRRLQRRMSVHGLHDVSEYASLLRESNAEAKALLKDILISVTSFFRDPEAFDALKVRIRELMERSQGADLRVWVAGCATGEEAYSIAMIIAECLDEVEKPPLVTMYATDIDAEALSVARAAVYPANISAGVMPERLRRFFTRDGKSYRVKKELREMVVFVPQDFIKDPPFSRMDLICCRNLLIYLEGDVQKRMLPLLHYALKPGGILFLGTSETIGEATDLFNTLDKKWKIYQRREVMVPAERLKFPAAFKPAVEVAEAAGELAPEVAGVRIPELTEKIFLDNYAPTFAIVDEKYRLIYVRGRTGKYLEIASGEPSLSILDMAREGLRTELASALYRATSDKKKVVREGLHVRYNSGFQLVNLTVAPLDEYGMPSGLLMVVFQEVGPVTVEAKPRPLARSSSRVTELEDELKLSRENLQSTIEELEATNEELKSANEELQSNNEELQSTNEELDTSREELQSLNEELTTLNAELQDKNEQLTKANDDLGNFLNRTDIAIIFLDEELKIRSFTPATADVFNIRNVDVSRPLEEITSRLDYPGLTDDAGEVLRAMKPREIEVQRKDGHWYMMRILPYLTAHNEVSGLVMSFLDIDKQKRSEESLQKAHDELEKRVEERTAELRQANTQLKEENEERVRTEQSLRLEQSRIDALLHLSEMSEAPIDEVAGFLLERGIALTGSKIGFVGFLSEDESVYTLNAVSRDVVKECGVEGDPLQWHVVGAGIWADAIRERRTLFVNDYSKPYPNKKGLPPGHPPVSKLMVVPLFDGKKIVAVAGMGNKASDYDQSDERQITLLLSGMWNHVLRNRSQEELQKAYGELEKRVEQRTAELQESQHDLKRAQEVAQTGSWRMDIRRNRLLWSDETYRIFGITKGKPMTYETFLAAVHPEDREYVGQKWDAALQGEDYDIEHRIIARGKIKKVKWVREKAELEFDRKGMLKGGFGTVQDITERKAAEEDLRQTRDNLDNLITYANAPIIVWDPELKITRFNNAFERLTGRSAAEMVGQKVDILIPKGKQRQALEKINRTTKKGERWEVVEIPIQHVDGSVRTVLWNSATLYEPDGKTPLATIAQGQDITELKKTDKLKDEFIGLVSHELRTPLTVVSGSLRSAMSPGVSEEDIRELIQNAVEGSDQLAAILENMLELSRFQANRLQLRMELVNIADTARGVIERLKGRGAGQRFSVNFPASLPLVEVDAVRVERILYNLLENAVKYSPAQSEIKVSGRREGDFIVTSVSDQGKGIPDGEKEKLFELFGRLEEASYAKGAGLGLVVCKRLVEAMGGWIKVYSEPGKGSTFTFALPIRWARA